VTMRLLYFISQRATVICHYRCYSKMSWAIIVGEFGASEKSNSFKQDWSFEGIIQKISVKTRQWRETTIIQGFQVHLQDGFSHAYGMNYNEMENVTDLAVPPGLQIRMVQVRSGVFINSLALVLDDGQVLGPVGSEDGGQLQDIASRLPKDDTVFYLSGISGSTVRSYKAPCICLLKFKFTSKQWAMGSLDLIKWSKLLRYKSAAVNRNKGYSETQTSEHIMVVKLPSFRMYICLYQ